MLARQKKIQNKIKTMTKKIRKQKNFSNNLINYNTTRNKFWENSKICKMP